MRAKGLWRWLVVCSVVCWLSGPGRCRSASLQQTATDGGTIPDPLRDRLDLLVRLEREDRWDEVYGLLMAEYKHGDTQDEFVTSHRRLAEKRGPLYYELIGFSPDGRITFHEPTRSWAVAGCATTRMRGRIRSFRAYVEAVPAGNSWLLSPVLLIARREGGYYRCSP